MLTALLVALVVQASPQSPVSIAVAETSVTVTVRSAAVKTIVAIPERVDDDEPESIPAVSLTRESVRGADVVVATFDRPRTDFWIDVHYQTGAVHRFDRAGKRVEYILKPITRVRRRY